MIGETGANLIGIVTDAGPSRLHDRLESETSATVRSIPHSELEAVLSEQSPDAVVVELDCAETVRECLECVRAATDAPTVVAPPTGAEPIAAAALRSGATEYAPLDRDGSIERIRQVIKSDGQTATSDDDRSYHQLLANELPDEAFLIDETGTYLDAKVRPESGDLYTVTADELTGNRLEDAFPDDVARRLQACLERAIETGQMQTIEYEAMTTEGMRQFEARVVPSEERIEGRHVVIWLARDVTERARREQRLRSRQAELETLNRINAVSRQVIETLVEMPGQNRLEQEVCDQLVDSELYCGSWIAGLGPDDELRYRTGAGDADAYLECVQTIVGEHEIPAAEAARSSDVETATNVLETEALPEPLQEAAREDSVGAVIAVPIVHEAATYGILSVLSGREDAFSETEQSAFELLGETMGFTIMAIKNRQLLFSDSVVELEFRIDGGDTFSFDLTEGYDCTCSLEWTGTTASGRTYQYVAVDGLDSETVLEEATAHDSVEECRLIHDAPEQCTIEMRLSESGVRILTNHGVTIRDVTVENGVGTCLVEVPQDANVRAVADALESIYENTELVARRTVDRPVRTAAERRNRILDELTDRQLTTLRLAYYGGFFEWPRESTGEEIAEAMDVTPPTMHQHLRKGLETILREFFDTDSSRVE